MTQRRAANGAGSTLPDNSFTGVINAEEDDESKITGFRSSLLSQLLTWISYLLTAFLLRLVFHWRPDWHIRCTHARCQLAVAEKILVKDQYNQVFVHNVVVVTKSGTRVSNRDWVKLLRKGQLWTGCGSDVHEIECDSNTRLINPYRDDSLLRYFFHKKVKYIWDNELQQFHRITPFNNSQCSQFHQTVGLTDDDADSKRVIFGDNTVHIPLTPIWKLFALKTLHPFYIFQLFSVILWYNDEYAQYATCIVVISVLSLSVSVFEEARNERNLRKTLVSAGEVTVSRGIDTYVSISSEQLVPGDVIEIPKHGCAMHCDAVLVSGNCIVNESMLTGESVPVLKTGLPQHDAFCMKEHSKHMLYCGTQVIQTRFVESQRVRAVVLRTGFSTAKGEMVRSILFPKPIEFKFNRDILHYMIVLGLFAAAGFSYTIVLMLHRGYPIGKIFLRALDLITIVVPPALPAAMTIGIVFAQTRLRKAGIFCISPNTINISGLLNCICFDKTGTLTEDGLDLWGVVPVSDKQFGAALQQDVGNAMLNYHHSNMLETMACCHSLTRIEGVLSGDPLDLKMFQATGWQLEEPEGVDYRKFDQLVAAVVRPVGAAAAGISEAAATEGQPLPYELGIVRQFAFSSSLQRMSVVARRLGADHFTAYVKGSPEALEALSKPESVPVDFHQQLLHYTKQGYRVIALAYKPLRVTYVRLQKLGRDQVERDLIFLGLLVMENRLKPQTTSVIHQLLNANIRPVMVTGDNLLTALSVARDCDIIGDQDSVIIVQATPANHPFKAQVDFHYAGDLRRKVQEVVPEHAMAAAADGVRDPEIDVKEGNYHLAMTGRSWQIVRDNFPHLIPKLVVKGAVFARFSPDQKAQLIESLQQVGYTVGMCGDGANDCGALKTAHAGVSLSEAEASVASPFTSHEQNITCVPRLIREGRCALVTSFGTFKFMAGYSITQFVSCLILYFIGCNLTDGQFLYIDLYIITSLSITFGYTKPYPALAKEPPSARLMSTVTIASIITQSCISIAYQTVGYLWIQLQPWFYPFSMDIMEDEYASYENTIVFIISAFQYITLAIAFAKSAPYRLSLFSNYAFLLNLIILIGSSVYIVWGPFAWLKSYLELLSLPEGHASRELKILVLGVILSNFLIAYVAETAIDSTWFRLAVRNARRRVCGRGSKEYERIKEELVRSQPVWPQISRSASAENIMAGHGLLAFGANPTANGIGSLSASGDAAEALMHKSLPTQAQQQQQQQQQQLEDSVHTDQSSQPLVA